MTELNEIKAKYPLAVEALKTKEISFLPDSGYLLHYEDVIGRIAWFKGNLETQDEIGKMLAELLNLVAKQDKAEYESVLVGETTIPLSYTGLKTAPIGTPVYKDKQGYFINFEMLGGGFYSMRYPSTAQFEFTAFTPIAKP